MKNKERQEGSARDHTWTGNWRRFAFVLLRLFLGGVFCYASFDKILRPSAFAEIIYNYQILPEPLINLASIFLPWLELLLGLLLILGFWLPGTVLISDSLLLVFFAALIFNSARGLNIDCGCFSVSPVISSGGQMPWYLLRDGIFLLLGLCLFSAIFLRKRKGRLSLNAERGHCVAAPSERSIAAKIWVKAIRQAGFIALIALALGPISNQIRSDPLPLFGTWSPEARLALMYGKNSLISLDEAKERFLDGSAIFIDARPEAVYRKGHIQDARNLPLEAFDEKASTTVFELPEDTLIITYCDGERCTLSAELYLKLKEIGYENVRVLFDGWRVWKSNGLPTESSEDQEE